LRLEPIDVRHADDLLALYRDPAVAEWYGKWTREQIDPEVARIARCWQVEGVHKWMAYHRVTSEPVGRGGLSRQHIDGHVRLELGWALHRRFWGQGYATEIGRAGLTLAFDELGADEVVSFTEARNRRSRAVMERLGFHYRKHITIDGEPFALYALRRHEDLPTTAALLVGRDTPLGYLSTSQGPEAGPRPIFRRPSTAAGRLTHRRPYPSGIASERLDGRPITGATSVREDTPSLRRMFETCTAAVFGEM